MRWSYGRFSPEQTPSHKKKRLAELAAVFKFERLKPPYFGVTVDPVIRPFFSIVCFARSPFRGLNVAQEEVPGGDELGG